jgi:hypothetical protein
METPKWKDLVMNLEGMILGCNYHSHLWTMCDSGEEHVKGLGYSMHYGEAARSAEKSISLFHNGRIARERHE